MNTIERFKTHQSALGLTNLKMASLLHVSERTVERWRQGPKRPPELVFSFLMLYRLALETNPELLKCIKRD
jgi:DNA-binding transcriptional regulator YiaG